jgi:hypothetical protein
MANKAYTTRQAVENYLLITIDQSFYAQIETWIGEVEAHIDQETEQNFKADTVNSIKKYNGNGSNELLIDNCVSISSIVIKATDGTIIYDDLVEGTDYFLEPANETPKNKITLYGYRFSRGMQNIEVNAKWGYSVDVPANIQFAAMVLLANIINASFTSEGELQSLTAGKVTMTFKQQTKIDDYGKVENILESYKKYNYDA